MAPRRSVFIALMLLVCAGLPACGTMGRTSSFVLTLDLPKGQKAGSDIHTASAAMDANAAHLTVVKVRPWRKFGLDDLRNLEHSLRDTIAPHLLAPSRATESRLDIHRVIRRYVVGVSNSGGAVLACVAWAATANRTLIYEEQFYASDAGYLIGTIGGLKDSVHEAIVRRIATTSLALAADPAAAHPRPTTFDKTSTSLDEAVARLPRVIEIVPLGVPTPISPVLAGLATWPPEVAGPIVVIGTLIEIRVFDGAPFRRSGESTMQWEVANPSDNFDWQGYLEKLYPSR